MSQQPVTLTEIINQDPVAPDTQVTDSEFVYGQTDEPFSDPIVVEQGIVTTSSAQEAAQAERRTRQQQDAPAIGSLMLR